MLKKINIQVGLFLMLAIFGCGKSKGDKGKASTPAARKANMEKVLEGTAGKKAESDVLELLTKKYKAEGKTDPDSEAKKVLETIKDMVFAYAKKETISSAEIDKTKKGAGVMFFPPGSTADPKDKKAAIDQLSQFIDMLAKAHGGLQQ